MNVVMGMDRKGKGRQIIKDCNNCIASSQPCDGYYPCTQCQQSLNPNQCTYPLPSSSSDPIPSTSTAPFHFHKPVLLERGWKGGVRLKPVEGRNGLEGLEWEEAVEQREELRLRKGKGRTRIVYPPSIWDRNGSLDAGAQGQDWLESAGDATLLSFASQALLPTSLHPTLLLNSLLDSRSPQSSSVPIPHPSSSSSSPHNNNLPNANPIACCKTLEGNHQLAWVSGDKNGRGTRISYGETREGKWRMRRTPLDFETNELGWIQDVQLVPLSSSSSSILGTLSSTRLSLSLLPSSPSTSPLQSYTYTSTHLHHRPISSFSLSPFQPGSGVLVDTSGTLYSFGMGVRGTARYGDDEWDGGRSELFKVRKGREDRKGAQVEWYGNDSVGVRWDDKVLLYDLRSPTSSLSLLSLSSSTERTTSLLSSSAATLATLIPICTTSHVLWIDPRMTSSDKDEGTVVKWKHERRILGRELDNTLSLSALPSLEGEKEEGVRRMALHSKMDSVVEILTWSAKGEPKLGLEPYDAFVGVEEERDGVAFVQDGEGVGMIERGRDGRVIEQTLRLDGQDAEVEGESEEEKWVMERMEEFEDVLGMREKVMWEDKVVKREVKLDNVLEDIWETEVHDEDEGPMEEQAIVRRMEDVLDEARKLVENSEEGTVISAYEAITTTMSKPTSLSQLFPLDLAGPHILSRLSSWPSPLKPLHDDGDTKWENLARSSRKLFETFDGEKRLCDELVLEGALRGRLFVRLQRSEVREEDGLDGRRNRPLDAESVPPPLSISNEGGGVNEEDLGSRRLLAEWGLGSDPKSYVWTNAYAKEDPGSSSKKAKSKEMEDELLSSQSQSQSLRPRKRPLHPPTIWEREELPSSPRLAYAASQPVVPSFVFSGSQESEGGTWGAASQVVPGVFGERQRKKVVKKRVSGF